MGESLLCIPWEDAGPVHVTTCHGTVWEGQNSMKHTIRTGWSYQQPQGIISSLHGKLEPTSYPQTPSTSFSSLCSLPSENLQTLFLHTLPMQRNQDPSGNLTAALRPEMLVVRVLLTCCGWVAEGQVELKAPLVWMETSGDDG